MADPLPAAPRPAPDGDLARWEIDIGAARAVLAGCAGDAPPPSERVAAILAACIVVDVHPEVVDRVGGYFGQDAMLGRAIGTFWPPESAPDLAALIVASSADPSPAARRSRRVASVLLRDPLLTVRRSEVHGPGRMVVEIEGAPRDARSPWALRASELRYRSLIHHLPVALLQVDARAVSALFDRLRAEGVEDLTAYLERHPALIAEATTNVRITEVNRSAERLFGGPDARALIGPVAPVFAASPATAGRVMVAHFEGRRSYAETARLQRLDGRLLDVRLSFTFPNPPEQADVTLISIEDLTERLRTEAQLRQLQADFTRAARITTLGELATSIAHEVSQPLAAILTNAETSLRWLGRDAPNLAKVTQLTERIAASAHRASEIVRRIRAMAARRAPERAPLDLNEIVREALVFLRHDLEARAIALAADLAPQLPAVSGDRVQIQQVVVNLLVNAVQAADQGPARPGAIDLVTQGRGEAVTLCVRDNGTGIAPDALDRLFDGFFTTKADGIGIGLAICQSIVTAHGGTIAASNHPDGGALFRVSLPVA